jgi:hypothetical protein
MMTSVWTADGAHLPIGESEASQISNYYVSGRGMNLLMVYYLFDQNPVWLQLMEGIVDRMAEIAVDKGDYAYFPSGLYAPDADVAKDLPMPSGMNETGGRMLLPLAQLIRATGYEPAKDLARKLAIYLVDRSGYFDSEGRFIFDKNLREHFGASEQELGGHFHNHSYILHALLEYALAENDTELIAFCRSGYEWARTQGCDLVGFFPEFIVPDYPSSEICEVADMLAIAVKLSQSGAGDYYSDIERWTRNQFVANQLQRCDWIYRLADRSEPKPVAENEVADRVAERNVGSFAGWSSGNEWAIDEGIMHCCTGNGARSIYYIWNSAVDFSSGELKVNLLFNHDTPQVSVRSHIPYRGQIDFKLKQACDQVLVHKPSWVSKGSEEVQAIVNGIPRPLTWRDNYLALGPLAHGDKVEVSFPITEWETKQHIGNRDYALVLKGDTVVHIDPPGRNGPLYQRDHYRENETRWVERERFVASTAPDY